MSYTCEHICENFLKMFSDYSEISHMNKQKQKYMGKKQGRVKFPLSTQENN